MRGQAPGWRTAASFQGRRVAGSPATGVVARATAAVAVPAVPDADATLPWRTPLLRGIEWTPTYVCFLAFMFAITTYKLPIGELSMAGALVGLFMQREPMRVPPMLGWLGAFVAWATIGCAVSPWREHVTEHWVLLVKLWLIVLVAVNALRTPAQIRFFALFFLACFALFPVRGALINFYFTGYSMSGRALWNYIYNNPNDLAAIALLQFGIVVGFYLTEPKGWARWAALAGMAIIPVLILLTQSRGAFVSLCVFGLFALAAQKRRLRALVVTGLLGTVAAMAAPSSAWERFGGLKNATNVSSLEAVDAEGSAHQRFEIWKVATVVTRENPMIGVGVGAYGFAHGVTASRPSFHPTARGRRDTHSMLLNVSAETGVVGLVLFLGIFASIVIPVDRTRRRVSEAMPEAAARLLYLELALLAYFIAGIWGSFARITFMYVHLAMLWVIAEQARTALAAGGTGSSAPRAGARRRIA